jgi:membrane associated rhomboid family serine protease
LNEQPANSGNWTRASAPVLNAPGIVLALIGVLVLVHAARHWAGESWNVWSLQAFALIPARFTKPGFPMPEGAEYWSLLTYGLLHRDWTHLGFNSLWLLVFGTPAARYLGTWRFLALCGVATVTGGLASLALHWSVVVYVVGASAAVSGLLAAAIPVMYGRRIAGGWRPLAAVELLGDRRAAMFMGIWLLLTLITGATGWSDNSFATESGIAWEAHIGGFFGGLAGFYVLARKHMQGR